MSRSFEYAVLGAFVLICLMAGAAAGWVTATSVDSWYVTLIKPSWTPPGRVFGPVWTCLYFLMGLSAWLVWKERGQSRIRAAMLLFFIQLFMNAAWSFLFFGMHRPDLAFYWMGILWTFILMTGYVFFRINAAAAFLLVPYILWVTFAQILNFEIYRLNLSTGT